MAAGDALPVADLLERLDQQRRRAVRLREQANARRSHAYQLRSRAEAAQERARSMVQDGQYAKASLRRLRELDRTATIRDQVRRITSEIQAFLSTVVESQEPHERTTTARNPSPATRPAGPGC